MDQYQDHYQDPYPDQYQPGRSQAARSDGLDLPTHAAARVGGHGTQTALDDDTAPERTRAASALSGAGQQPGAASPGAQPSGGSLVPGQRATAGVLVGDRYTLRTAIGHGGMGTVWRASDSLLRRDVAVKEVLLPQGLAPADRDAMYQRTMREARAAAALSHPAVVQVYDVVTDGGRPWIVMELLQARSLSEIIVEDGPLAPRAVAKIGIALLGALEVAHAAGVLHRDVKPANVLICSDGRCVLTDFGVARMPTDSELTTPGMVLGSPHFISPERAIGAPFGPPSDLFSLGVTLYTAVEGKPPFDKGDPFETMRAVVEEQPVPPVRAGALAELLYGLLEKDPARRWDVSRARTVLRDLMAGPLASTAPAHVTDPYAVVRPAPWQPPPGSPEGVTGPAVLPQQSAQIGGRAMLAPGESLTDRLRRLRESATAAGAAGAAGVVAGGALSGSDRSPAAVDAPTGAMPAAELGPDDTVPVRAGEATRYSGPADAARNRGASTTVYGSPPGQAGPPATEYLGGHPGQGGGFGGGFGPQPGGYAGQAGHPGPGGYPAAGFPHQGGYPGSPGGPPGGAATVYGGAPGQPADAPTGGSLLDKLRAQPRTVQVGAVGGLALILVIVLVSAVSGWFGGGDDGQKTGSGPAPAKSSAAPSVPTQHFKGDNGIEVDVPEGWTRNDVSTYTDFTEPGNTGRRVRINVDKAGVSARQFLGIAEKGLKGSTKVCAAPYQQIAVRDTKLDGRDGAELEYTCGSGGEMRHGIWGAVTVNGKAYHFYLTTPDADFEKSKAIFDQMATSFQLDPAVVGN